MIFHKRMCAIALRLIAGVALMVVSPTMARAEKRYASVADDKLLAQYEKAVSKAAKAENPDFCMLLPMLNEMESRPGLRENSAKARLFGRFQCAVNEYRHKDAYTLLAEMEKMNGSSLPDELVFEFALLAEEYPQAASRIIKMASSTDGSALGTLEMQLFWQLSRGLIRNKHSEIRLRMFRALADSPHLDRLSPAARSGIAQVALTLDAENGVFDRAKMLSGELQGPYPFLELLANRKLEPIWPALEEIAGPNLQKIADAHVVTTSAAYNRDKGNREAFQHNAHALHFAGKFEDAIALVQTLDHRPKALLKATEHDLWAMNIEAYALDALGRKSEAEAVFDAMGKLPFEGERRSWLVNFVINRATRLVGLGQWQKGLEATMLAHEVTEQSGSPFAKMLVRKARICALVNLGSAAEAAPLLIEAFERRVDAYATAAEAHLCAGDNEKAATVVLEALNDQDHRYDMAQALQAEDFEIFYVPEVLPSLRESLKQRPEINAAFNAVARDIPDRFVPGASLRRRQIGDVR